MTTVETIDFDSVFHDITARLQKETEQRLHPPLIRLWDGDWNLRGEVKQEITASFTFRDDDTGMGVLEMPLDYYLSRWCVDVDERAPGVNIHVTVDKDGSRWGGRACSVKVLKGTDGRKIVRVEFKHDREELKYILVYPNPFACPPAFN